MKYLQSKFTIVGEPTKKAQDAFRENYVKVNWKDDGKQHK